MVLRQSALDHNLALMSEFCRTHGVQHAPHGKTHMAPQLARLQLEAGAWGVTAATMSQVDVFRRFGARRIILANELADPAAIGSAARMVTEDRDLDFYCLVDSVAGVERMNDVLAHHETTMQVLLEVGIVGGRAGCRSGGQALDVATAVSESSFLELAGIEGYEGIIRRPTRDATLSAVRLYLDEMRDLVYAVEDAALFGERTGIIISAGGSAFFDLVVERLSGTWAIPRAVEVVLRSGCYLTHDSGMYEELSPFGARAGLSDRFVPALEIWGTVISRPEPDLAILNFGKRDAPYDAGLPIPETSYRAGHSAKLHSRITAMNDQHAHMSIVPDDQFLKVGDAVGCAISHPCTAFDKWSLIPVVDDSYDVVDAVRTLF
jgi:D-serine dehydratase